MSRQYSFVQQSCQLVARRLTQNVFRCCMERCELMKKLRLMAAWIAAVALNGSRKLCQPVSRVFPAAQLVWFVSRFVRVRCDASTLSGVVGRPDNRIG
jgi:hypothetical protein